MGDTTADLVFGQSSLTGSGSCAEPFTFCPDGAAIAVDGADDVYVSSFIRGGGGTFNERGVEEFNGPFGPGQTNNTTTPDLTFAYPNVTSGLPAFSIAIDTSGNTYISYSVGSNGEYNVGQIEEYNNSLPPTNNTANLSFTNGLDINTLESEDAEDILYSVNSELAFDSSSNLYIADGSNNRVVQTLDPLAPGGGNSRNAGICRRYHGRRVDRADHLW